MALSIDSLRNFAGTGSITLDQQHTGIEESSKLQRLKSFFGIGDARQKNAETLTAIHHAILNDPQFFSKDVQQKAVDLLSQVRTDRAIGAAAIKSIIAKLDGMSSPVERRNAAANLMRSAFEARPRPPFLTDEGVSDYLRLARYEVVPSNDPPGGYGRFDYNAALDRFEAKMQALFTRLGDGAGDKEVLNGCLMAFRTGDSKIKPQDKLEALVDQLKANLDEGRALAQEFGDDQTRLDVAAMVKSKGRPIAATDTLPDPIRTFVTAGRNAPKDGLLRLTPNSSAAEFNATLIGFGNAITNALKDSKFAEAEDARCAKTLAIRSAMNTLTAPQKEALLDALESETGKAILDFYASQGSASLATTVAGLGDTMVMHLRSVLGRPNAGEMIVQPEQINAPKLTASVLSQFSIHDMATGNATDYYQGLLGDVDIAQAEGKGPHAYLTGRMNALATAKTAVNICQQMAKSCEDVVDAEGHVTGRRLNPDKETAFALDLPRNGVRVNLPDGGKIGRDTDLQTARNKIVQFITGNPNAKFSEVDQPVKVKAMLLMAVLNQSAPATTLSAFEQGLMSCQKTKKQLPILGTNMGKPREESFALSKDASGDITVKYHIRRYVNGLPDPTVQDLEDQRLIMLDDESYEEFEMEIKFPAANLDALSRVDWTTYDHAPVNAAEGSGLSTDSEGALKLVPDGFKFLGTATTATHLHLEKAPEPQDA